MYVFSVYIHSEISAERLQRANVMQKVDSVLIISLSFEHVVLMVSPLCYFWKNSGLWSNTAAFLPHIHMDILIPNLENFCRLP